MARRTAEEAALTRRRLLAEARRLFVDKGFDDVTTADIAAAAGVTRGALHHHFGDKRGLFEEVYKAELEAFDEKVSALGREAAERTAEVWPALVAGIDGYLDLCLDRDVNQIMLVQAPAALGWQRWDELDRAFSVAQLTGVLEVLVATGDLAPQPVVPVAEVVVGALNQVGRLIALSSDPVRTRTELGAVVLQLVEGLRRPQT